MTLQIVSLFVATLVSRAAADIGVRFVCPDKKPGQLSAGVYRPDGTLLRMLKVLEPTTAPKAHEIYWDGLDDDGQPVATGKYLIRGAVANVEAIYDGVIGNGRQPSSFDDLGEVRGCGSSAAAFDRAGNFYVSIPGGERRTLEKFSPDGKMLWRMVPQFWNNAIACDDDYVYVVGREILGDKNQIVLIRVRCRDGKFVGWDDLPRGVSVVVPADKYVANHWTKQRTVERQVESRLHPGQHRWMRNEIHSIAAAGGFLYIPIEPMNEIVVVDLKRGAVVRNIEGLPGVHAVATDGAHLFFLLGDRVQSYDLATGAQKTVIEGLDQPINLSLTPQGELLVVENGAVQRIRRFTADGRETLSLGRPGPLNGRCDDDRFFHPSLAVADAAGNILVVEPRLTRIRKYDRNGKYLRGIEAIYAETHCTDPADERIVWATDNTGIKRFEVDYAKRTWKTTGFWDFTGYACNKMWPETMYVGDMRVVRISGKTFLYVGHFGFLYIMRVEGDDLRVVGFLSNFYMAPGQTRFDADGKPIQSSDPNTIYYWHDRNGNSEVETEEIAHWSSGKVNPQQVRFCVDSSGNLTASSICILDNDPSRTGRISYLPLRGLDEGGCPLYREDDSEVILEATERGESFSSAGEGPGGNFYAAAGRHTQSSGMTYWAQFWEKPSIRKYSPGGKLLWKVGKKTAAFVSPGELYTANRVYTDGKYIYHTDTAGPVTILDENGLILGFVLKDQAQGYTPDNDLLGVSMGESWCAHPFVHHKTGVRYYLIQDHGTSLLRRYRITGLEDVSYWSREVNLRKAAPQKQSDSKDAASGPKMIEIGTASRSYRIDGNLSDWEDHAAETLWTTPEDKTLPYARVRLRWTPEHLYFAVEVFNDDTPCLNQNADKGNMSWAGDCFEIYINPDPGADRKATKFGKHHLQLLAPIDRNTQPRVYCITRMEQAAEAQAAFVKHADGKGYSLEGSIPWKYLSDIEPQPNTRIPFYMKVTYGNRDGAHYAFQLDWSGAPTPFNDPSGWNNALISGFKITQ